MVFIHKFISLFKHASEFTDTINNNVESKSSGSGSISSPARRPVLFFSLLLLLLLIEPLVSLWFRGLPQAIDDWLTVVCL